MHLSKKSAWNHGHRSPTTVDETGFTLLELLISLTILAMIVVILFGAFRIGIRAWEKGEKEVTVRQRERIVLDLVRHQLASICMGGARDDDGQPVRFRGDPQTMSFLSCLPLTPGGLAGPTYVKYAVRYDADGQARLVFYERDMVSPVAGIGADEPDQAAFTELLADVSAIAFEYLKTQPEESESPWQDAWDPEVEKGPPRAVRLTLRENENKAPIYVIAAAGE